MFTYSSMWTNGTTKSRHVSWLYLFVNSSIFPLHFQITIHSTSPFMLKWLWYKKCQNLVEGFLYKSNKQPPCLNSRHSTIWWRKALIAEPPSHCQPTGEAGWSWSKVIWLESRVFLWKREENLICKHFPACRGGASRRLWWGAPLICML